MNKVKAIYKAIIYEYENGKTEIIYDCDIKKNKYCSKKNCDEKFCSRTLDKKYAKNYFNVRRGYPR